MILGRRPRFLRARGLVALIGIVPAAALAHSFGQVYRLPVPVWLYLYGACAALALSFLVMVFFLTADTDSDPEASSVAPAPRTCPTLDRWMRRMRIPALLACAGVIMLALCIASGLFGVAGPYANFSMTAFWILFLLGLAYASAVVGDVYRLANPWRALCNAIGHVWHGFADGRFRYPARLAYWPALVFYMGLVWLELFGDSTPFSLAVVLSAYTVVNLVGVGLIGTRHWFRYCEIFSVLFRLIGLMAPIAYAERADGAGVHIRLRAPFSGLRRARVVRTSLLLFILFMLSSTAFDGLHETVAWRRLYWIDLNAAVLSHWVGNNPIATFPALLNLYQYWQALCLLLSPFAYLAVYWCFVALMRAMADSRESVGALARRFAPSLLPIALAYHLSHYYTLLQTQGLKIVPLASDPFGTGWDLFGTADWWQRSNVPDPSTVWHVQVGVIVLGHIIGVYVSHAIALDVFASRRRAALSQLPMLVLMLAFTAAGLWILAQPIQGGA
jgi:hypothetical protein